MTNSKLKTALQPIVQEFGLAMVLRSLAEIADGRFEYPEDLGASSVDHASGLRQSKPKVTAAEYVRKMELPLEKAVLVSELAERFQQKSFLPTFGDVASFCQKYEMELPASKTRANAIPRIFKFIAEMETSEIQSILDYGLFSGPSKLRPISDAIRNYSNVASKLSDK